ncbi:MAG: MerR family transcriptional regulator, thiopeptide resistance regulator [Thermomicrobiales bacterium]|nr:MerR family transcriptional regulator, thiopeptide resistance regulator [Thermomicrobiales bacterium]
MSRRGMTVGELARRSGVSVRTLHHYETVGLLMPAGRTEAGYRHYDDADVVRLHQIRSLRQLGFGLEQVRELLDGKGFSPLQVIELHIAQLRQQIEGQQRLSVRLEGIAATLRAAAELSVDELLTTIEEMTRVETYYTPEQLAELQERGRQLGEDGLRRAEADWQQLIDEVRAEMERGTDPASERVKALASRWQALVEAFTGDNPEIGSSLQRMWQQDETIHGFDTAEMRKLGEYIAQTSARATPEA